MHRKLTARAICLAFVCMCLVVVMPTGFQLLTHSGIPGLGLTASAAQVLREARRPAERVRLFEEEMRRRVTGSGNLMGKLGKSEVKPKAGLLNKHSDLISLSQPAHQVGGVLRDGQVVKIRLPESFWSQFGDKDYSKLLPGDPDDYKQMGVATGRSTRFIFDRVGGDWISSSPLNGWMFTAPPKPELHTLKVTQIGDVEIVSMYPVGNEGGASIWVLTPDDRTATAEIAEHIHGTSGVAHEGDDLPEDLRALLSKSGVPYMRKSDRSANVSAYDVQRAVDLGNQPLSAANTKIFNALPYEQGFFASWQELGNMDLERWRGKEWQELDSEVSRSAGANNLQLVRARKAEVISELWTGSADVVFLIAHSSGGKMYFSGSGGESLSLEEVSKIRRWVTPERTVVLLTCKGGIVNSETASFAEVMLRNKLARNVFASEEDVDGHVVPKLLQRISQGGVPRWKALRRYGLRQIVSLPASRTYGLPA